MNPAIILGKPTPDAIMRLFLPESTRLIDHQQIFGRELRELMPRPCQNSRLLAPTDYNLAEWGLDGRPPEVYTSQTKGK